MPRITKEDKALWDIIKQRPTDKKIMVRGGFTIDEPIDNSIEEAELEEKREILRKARMPWFCPECDKIMNKSLDDKMWYIYSMCFDCVLILETRLRIEGKWEEYEQSKMRENAISYLKEYKQQLLQGIDDINNPSFIQGSGNIEKWSGISLDILKNGIEEELIKLEEHMGGLENARNGN